MKNLPPHLQKYIVDQESHVYSPVDQAVWRFCLRQLKSFLALHAHEAYLDGLEKTGISIDRIPKISEISDKLSKFGWRALPVSGFIPPAAFMELQALNVLPIASDLRSLDHIAYTPAPDIVHEAAGHAPMLAVQEFADYLRQYAQVAKKAIISREDMDIYKAIRDLSDMKENPASTREQIEASEKHLARVTAAVTHISEATWLSRMNWWTAEYGLIGSLKAPKIFGAGLLSSVGESRYCLSEKVKKIPLTVDCIEMTYDITEPQPQLFVTPDFASLSTVLDDFAKRMAFKIGGVEGVKRIIQAETVNTVELESGLQISGRCVEILKDGAYLRFTGPTQLSFKSAELSGHGKKYHADGFSTPVGFLKKFPSTSPSQLSDGHLQQLITNGEIRLEYQSGVLVTGRVKNQLRVEGRLLILTLENANAELDGRVLFDPSWGTFDVAMGSSIPSVYGGPADREAYGDMDDFVAARITSPPLTERQKKLHASYSRVRQWRESNLLPADDVLKRELDQHRESFKDDWLLILEIYELVKRDRPQSSLAVEARALLQSMAKERPDQADLISDGISLIEKN